MRAIESTSVRFFFHDLAAAAQALIVVLTHARRTKDLYRFYGLSAPAILQSGLVLEGEVDGVSALIEAIPGTTRYDE